MSLDCVRTDDLVDDFCSKMVETDVLAHLVALLQDGNPELQSSSINAIATLAKLGRSIYYFGLVQGLMIQQMIST